MCGAAAGTLLWADGLQHPALALLQHVFLVTEAGQLAWNTVMEMDTTYSLCSILNCVLSELHAIEKQETPQHHSGLWKLHTV